MEDTQVTQAKPKQGHLTISNHIYTTSLPKTITRKTKSTTTNYFKKYYPLSLGFRTGSFERKPKRNRETKNVTTVYTKIFKSNICIM